MERTITLFVERSRQLLADFSLQAQRDGAAPAGAAAEQQARAHKS